MTESTAAQHTRIQEPIPALGLHQGDGLHRWANGDICVTRMVYPDEPGWQVLRDLFPPERPTLCLVDRG